MIYYCALIRGLVMSNTRIGFRGDDRDPINDKIFDTGLQPRQASTPIQYRAASCDTNKASAVCFTWRLSASTYFPLDPKKETAWIYVLKIDLSDASKDSIFYSRLNLLKRTTKEIFNETKSNISNIHGAQYLDSLLLNKTYVPKQVSTYLFADEMAAKQIPPQDILFAVKCVRAFNDTNHLKKGVKYQLVGPIIDNPNFKAGELSPEMIMLARQLIETEIQLSAKKPIDSPLIESGFQINNTAHEHKKIFRSR